MTQLDKNWKLITRGKFVQFRSTISRSRTRRVEYIIFNDVKKGCCFNLRKNVVVRLHASRLGLYWTFEINEIFQFFLSNRHTSIKFTKKKKLTIPSLFLMYSFQVPIIKISHLKYVTNWPILDFSYILRVLYHFHIRLV